VLFREPGVPNAIRWGKDSAVIGAEARRGVVTALSSIVNERKKPPARMDEGKTREEEFPRKGWL